jgi:hypothetical protein
LYKKKNLQSLKSFNNTILAEGKPSADAVASVIAFTSSIFACTASFHHCSNWSIGFLQLNLRLIFPVNNHAVYPK